VGIGLQIFLSRIRSRTIISYNMLLDHICQTPPKSVKLFKPNVRIQEDHAVEKCARIGWWNRLFFKSDSA